MKTRSKRISVLIATELSQIITTQMKDPRLASLITITRVQMKEDLRSATIFVSVFGNDQQESAALKALTIASGYMRKELGSRLVLKYIPEISFKIDSSILQGDTVLAVLDQALSTTEKDREHF